MFLLRSIRRRMATGFGLALGLILTLAATSAVSLHRYRVSVESVRELLEQSPNRDRLMVAVSRLSDPFHLVLPKLDLRRPEAVTALRAEFRTALAEAVAECGEFGRRVRDLELSPELSREKHRALEHVPAVSGRLHSMQSLVAQLNFDENESADARRSRLASLRQVVEAESSEIRSRLAAMPSYAALDQQFLVGKLQAEQQAIDALRLTTALLCMLSVSVFAMVVFLGFRWVSRPLRHIRDGAARIASGDSEYRIRSPTGWNDEFGNLTDTINAMADRFQQIGEELRTKVEERSRQLVRTEKMAGIGFLAAGMAHELNSPLQGMGMGAEELQLLLADLIPVEHPDHSEIFEILATIRSETRRCGSLTRELLSFARGSGRRSETTGQEDVTRIITEVLALIRLMGKYRDRRIEFSQSAPIIAELNPERIKQVFLNLIGNGLQAMQPGGTLRIAMKEQVDWVIIEIADDGSGMDSETIEHLFEPFYSTKEEGCGTGLGLFISQRIVTEHNGHLTAHSDGPGRGSTFRIRLPRRKAMRAVA